MHTEGPWERFLDAIVAKGGNMRICDIRGWGHLTGHGQYAMGLPPEEARKIQTANANLIAAAPDMLAALKECAERLRYDGDHHHDLGLESRRDASWEAMQMARDAIAKAEGN